MERHLEITISSCECGTWQGTLRAGARAFPFQSELELLLTMNRLLSDKPGEPVQPTFLPSDKE